MAQCRWCGGYYEYGQGFYCSPKCEIEAAQHGMTNDPAPAFANARQALAALLLGSCLAIAVGLKASHPSPGDFGLDWFSGTCLIGGICGLILGVIGAVRHSR
jgi:hypothetical protein